MVTKLLYTHMIWHGFGKYTQNNRLICELFINIIFKWIVQVCTIDVHIDVLTIKKFFDLL